MFVTLQFKPVIPAAIVCIFTNPGGGDCGWGSLSRGFTGTGEHGLELCHTICAVIIAMEAELEMF